MSVLDDVKALLGIDDAFEDNAIAIYIRKASTLINYYLNTSVTDVEATYPDAVIAYVIERMNKRGNEGLKQFSQGSRSGTYENNLSDDVKALLPAPYAKLR